MAVPAASACLDDNLAAEFATGALKGSEATRVEAHLAGCRDCRSLVAALAASSHDGDSDLDTSPRGPGHAPTEPKTGGRATEFAVGDRIGRYVVLGRLGQGGMGVVHSAYDPQLDRKVAIKLLRTGINIATAEARARMVREAKAIAQLSHPNVVAVYDVGTADPGDVYIAMEFVEGDTVTQWLRRWDRSWRDVLDVFLQAGRGLAAAHAAGLLHRDFKPDNVMVGADGRVRVGDFGLARSVVTPDEAHPPTAVVNHALNGSLTATGTVVGTPRYMAPETLQGKGSDARTDQFSFCVALYEALYHQHPLPGETAVQMVDTAGKPFPPPEETKIPKAIGRAIMRGLDVVPSKRFPSMSALIAELTPAPVRAPRKIAAAIAVGVLAAGAAGAAVIATGGGDETQTVAAEVTVLREQLKELKKERDELLIRLDKALVQGEADRETVVELREEIKRKDDQVQDLLVQLENVQLTANQQRPGIKPRHPAIKTSGVLALLEQSSPRLTGCFREWSERQPKPADGSLPDHDATLMVSMTVLPGGKGTDARTRGVNDVSLPVCVGDALRNLPFPAPGGNVRLEIAVDYIAASEEISVTPRIASVQDQGGTIDLTGDDKRPNDRIDLVPDKKRGGGSVKSLPPPEPSSRKPVKKPPSKSLADEDDDADDEAAQSDKPVKSNTSIPSSLPSLKGPAVGDAPEPK
jgi:tRNA A-37 threonylcarbamoyl transferase component Bud32